MSIQAPHNCGDKASISDDETLKSLVDMFDEAEATGSDVKPSLAELAKKRWNKKFVPEKIKLI